MKTRPRQLTLVATTLALIGLGMPAQILWLYGIDPSEWGQVIFKLTPLNWSILLLSPIVAYQVFRASPYALITIPMLTATVCYNNWLVAAADLNYSGSTVMLATFAFLLVMGLLANRRLLTLFLHPERRWWLTPERKRAEVPVRIKIMEQNFAKLAPQKVGSAPVHPSFATLPKRSKHDREHDLYTLTYDISEGGLFVPMHEKIEHESRQNLEHLKVGTSCFVCLPLRGLNFLQCRAEVVRTTPARGQYPAGVGIKFVGLTWEDKKLLGEFLKELPNASSEGMSGSGATPVSGGGGGLSEAA